MNQVLQDELNKTAAILESITEQNLKIAKDILNSQKNKLKGWERKIYESQKRNRKRKSIRIVYCR